MKKAKRSPATTVTKKYRQALSLFNLGFISEEELLKKLSELYS
ncbi:hypothetical protein [Bacillus sp. 1P06AnD]